MDTLLTVKISRGSYLIFDMDLCFPASKSWITDVYKKWIRYSFDSDRIMIQVRDYLVNKIAELEESCKTFTNKQSIAYDAHVRLLNKYKRNYEWWASLDPICGLT